MGGEGARRGRPKEFTKTKQLHSAVALKEEMVEEGGLNLNVSSVLFWVYCHGMAFSLLHRKEWI